MLYWQDGLSLSILAGGRGTKPEPTGLGGVGEGLWVIDSAQPLTQLRVSSKAANSAQPFPIGEGELARKRFLGLRH